MKCITAELWLTLTVFVSQKWKSNREIGCESLKSAYKSQAVVAPSLFAAEQKQKQKARVRRIGYLPSMPAYKSQYGTKEQQIPLICSVSEPMDRKYLMCYLNSG